jgi:hypothetical protein
MALRPLQGTPTGSLPTLSMPALCLPTPCRPSRFAGAPWCASCRPFCHAAQAGFVAAWQAAGRMSGRRPGEFPGFGVDGDVIPIGVLDKDVLRRSVIIVGTVPDPGIPAGLFRGAVRLAGSTVL